MPNQPKSQPGPPAPAAPLGPRDLTPRGSFIHLMIAVSILIVCGAAAIIYVHWVRTEFPTSYILVMPAPEETPEGAKVTISGAGREIATVTLTAAEQFRAPVLVESGEYTITVKHDGVTNARHVIVPQRRVVAVLVTTRPSTADESSER